VSLPEVLAPAGDRDCLEAAVSANADAVYLGVGAFNARARAKNFDVGAVGPALAHLHAHGKRGYITLNTLVFDEELGAVEAVIRTLAEAGADALIVQDLGVFRLARAVAPGLRLHASTQLTCTDSASVEFAASLGAERVTLARELTLEDVAPIAEKTPIELEVFVHGALCISYSGQCLTSEAIGGRSANRGACAQACRLPYELVVDGKPEPLGDRAYLLSPEDLEASALVPRLAQLGIRSLKIEGRLKQADYVAATTQLYRAAVDGLATGSTPDERTRQRALQAFTRGSSAGFLGGIDHQRLVEGRGCDHRGLLLGELSRTLNDGAKTWLELTLETTVGRGDGVLVEGGLAGAGEVGGRVWGVRTRAGEVERAEPGETVRLWLGPERNVSHAVARRRVWKTNDPIAEKATREALARSTTRRGLFMRLVGSFGQVPRLEAHTLDGVSARVALERPLEPATEHPLTLETARDKLGRLGDTPFELEELVLEFPGPAHIPLSALNRARRALTEALLTASHRKHAVTNVTASELVQSVQIGSDTPLPGGLFALCRSEEQARAALDAGADGIVLDFLELTGLGNAFRSLRSLTSAPLYVACPRIRKPGEQKIDDYLVRLKPDGVLVRSLGTLQDLGPGGRMATALPLVGDFSLNAANTLSAQELLSRGLAVFTPSYDLDSRQLTRLLNGPLAARAEVVVHHPMPLFHMEHCVYAARLSAGRDHKTCGRPCDRHALSLRDRAGMDHPVIADVGCRNTVFHAASQSAAALVPGLASAGVRRFRVEFVRETPAEVTRIITAYRALLGGQQDPSSVFTSLRAESHYGVVRGSLRVLG
jgi:putative protease